MNLFTMKKLISTCLLFVFFANITKAQFVEIPDPNFRLNLKLKYPNCFNTSDMMDTTCSEIVNETYLYTGLKEISSLEGFQYFRNLTYFECTFNPLLTLPSLPNSLQSLRCNGNKLIELPSLPSSLKYLHCSNNYLTELPILPDSLIILHCLNNKLSSLPALPKTLINLICSYNSLKHLPQLPSGLVVLECEINNLLDLPLLPNTILELDCRENNITSLTNLPNSLKNINCSKNKISFIQKLPTNLESLICSNNQLITLPPLPISIKTIDCGYNQLSSLPPLRQFITDLYCNNNQLNNLPTIPNSLKKLWVFNNPLNCLPLLPFSLKELYLKGTNLKCLPNAPINYSTDSLLNICLNQTDICNVNSMVKGIVFYDANNNKKYDPLTEITLQKEIITVFPNGWKGISDNNGTYLVKLDFGINTWSCNSTNKYATIYPNSYTVTPTSLGLLPNNYNFGIQLKPNIKDLEATLAGTAIRPGFITNIGVTANNIGTINQSNITVKLKKPAGYNVLATSTAPTSTLNDTLFWKNVSIDFLKSQSFYVELQVPVSAVLGTEIVYEAWVNGTQGDTTPIDNYTKWTETVRGSFDPNDKLVSKTTLPPTYDVEKDRLIYTIRFQNTGTDTAFYVRVKDEIPANLNLSTLRVINASHAYQLIVREKNIVEFAFPNINLPDKTTNEPKSHGFVQFSIQPKAGLPINTKIENNAAIYFDYNAPIITNFATTQVKLTTGLASNKNLDFKLFPNPTNGTVRIELPYNGDGNWILSDISGRQLKADNIANNEKLMELNLSDLPSGTYFITIQLGGNVSTAKIVKL
jgi:hypothetical protein